MTLTANLKEQRAIARRLLALDRPLVEIAADASRLAELVEALAPSTCTHCGSDIVKDDHGTWIDATGGDVCTENQDGAHDINS